MPLTKDKKESKIWKKKQGDFYNQKESNETYSIPEDGGLPIQHKLTDKPEST